ncbi:MAG: hypothetical protein D6701_05220 [Gemmatimonadetes bacterium]|nr:MAG: hypothetical protein D6701_05220 [Gemmatimonadota bacterium]
MGGDVNRTRRRSGVLLALAILAELFLPSPHELGVEMEVMRGPEPLQIPRDLLVEAMAAQDRHTDALLRVPGVVGTAIGADRHGRPVVQILTAAPGVAGLPASLDGFDIDVRVIGPVWALGEAPWAASAEEEEPSNPRLRFPRPVPIGVSTGQPDVTAGTIGARVTDGERVFALSNNHVYADRNAANIGDNVLQPGRADGGADPDHAIGTLFDFEPLRFCQGLFCPENRIDAAIALSSPDNLGTSTPRGGYGTPRSDPVEAMLNQEVQKFGRTTGHTVGRITGIHATVTVNYRTGNVRFVDQIIVSGGGFSQGGDSGSLIVTKARGDDDRRPVGLLFAGSAASTIANPIDLVLDRFGVRIDDGS